MIEKADVQLKLIAKIDVLIGRKNALDLAEVNLKAEIWEDNLILYTSKPKMPHSCIFRNPFSCTIPIVFTIGNMA
tara:strand:+ start:312 stop:536 length:225 start_codon:yes stop_codon:yes gene_type:complete